MLDFDYVCGKACGVGLGRRRLDLFTGNNRTAETSNLHQFVEHSHALYANKTAKLFWRDPALARVQVVQLHPLPALSSLAAQAASTSSSLGRQRLLSLCMAGEHMRGLPGEGVWCGLGGQHLLYPCD
jgi:hypothetical protein